MSGNSLSTQTLEEWRDLANILTKEQAHPTSHRFNIFRILLSETDEVRLHTRFLHCLLDPVGPHDCGLRFLDLFLATLDEHPGQDDRGNLVKLKLPPNALQWRVSKEAFSGKYGQIDILLEAGDFGLAIENKILAAEQNQQLKGYADFLSHSYPDSAPVLYLTLEGRRSATHGGLPYLRISYAEHILAWLEKCLEVTQNISSLHEVIIQYREVTRKLTGKTTATQTMKTAADFIAKNPGIIRSRALIDEAVSQARNQLIDKLGEAIAAELESRFQFSISRREDDAKLGSRENGSLSISPPKGLLRQAPFEIWVGHISSWRGLVVGVVHHKDRPPLPPEAKRLLESMDAWLQEYSSIHPKYHKASLQSNPGGHHWPTGWHNLIFPLDDGLVATLIESGIASKVAEVCDKIDEHVKLLEQAYCSALSAVVAT